MSTGELYLCDPIKNSECSKTGCFMNGGECKHTTKKEYQYKSITERLDEIMKELREESGKKC